MRLIELLNSILKENPYHEFHTIVFLDTETTKMYENTRYGLEWFNQVLSIQAGIYNNATKQLQKIILFNTDNILQFFSNLAKADSSTLVVGYNVLFDLNVIYRNLYMAFHKDEKYETVPAFKFHVLDLMICYDFQIASIFGKKEAGRSKAKSDFLITHLPVLKLHDGTPLSKFVYTKIEEGLKEKLGDYVEITPRNNKSIREVEERKARLKFLKTQEQTPEVVENIRELSKTITGTNSKFFSSLGVCIKVKKKLKEVMQIIFSDMQILLLEEDVGWTNIQTTDEFNYIIQEHEKENMDIAYDKNVNIILQAIEDRANGNKNKFLTYIEHDIDFLVLLMYALNFPETDFFQDEVLSQARVQYLGITLNQELLNTIQIDEVEDIESEIKKIAKTDINTKSSKQMREFFSKLFGFELEASNKKYLQRLLQEDEIIPEKYVPLVKRYLGYGSKSFSKRIVSSLISCGESGAHPTVYLNSTITNRGTCFGSVNWVGIPRNEEIRRSFIDVIGGDQSSAEVAVLAASIDDSFWNKMLCTGVDTHALVLSCKLGIEYPVIMASLKQEHEQGIQDLAKQRSDCKGILFAIFYGGTDVGIAHEKNVKPEFVAQIRDLLNKLFPKFGLYSQAMEKFRTYETMTKSGDWINLKSYIGETPTVLKNMFGFPAYAVTSKVFQIVVANICESVMRDLNKEFPALVIVRDKNRSKPQQSIGNAVWSALLGSIGRTQGDIQRRMQDLPIQSTVSIITKLCKSFLYRNFNVGVQDIHDEILIIKEKNLQIEKLDKDFKQFVLWIKQFIPAFNWDLDTVSGYWKK